MKKQVSQEILDCCQDRGELPEFFDIEIGKDFRLETKPIVTFNAHIFTNAILKKTKVLTKIGSNVLVARAGVPPH